MVFYIDPLGECASEHFTDWATARDALGGLLEMIDPPGTLETFQRELKAKLAEKSVYLTDGKHNFAIEMI